MKRIHTMQLTGAGSRQALIRGNYQNDKGKLLKAVRAKFTVPIANATGGNLASGLSDARKQLLLSKFRFWVNYGKDGIHKPFDGVDGARMHREARFAFGSEIEGYSDSTTGLTRSMDNGLTTSAVFYLPIPLGFLWMLEARDARLFGMGRSQSKTLQIEIQQDSATIDTGLTIDGNVQVELLPHVESCKGDPWGAVPHYRQTDSSNDEVEGPEGLPLRISERTAVHASSSLTSFNLQIDDEVIHEAISPQDSIVEYNDLALATSAGSLTDRETVLYAVGPTAGANLADLPAGKPKFRQVVKNLSTIQLSWLFLPIIGQSDVQSALTVAASSLGRGKELKAASLRVTRGAQLPDRLESVLGFILLDRDDREFEQVPGLTQSPGESEPRLLVPENLRERALKQFQGHKAAGEDKAAAQVVKSIASAVPGAVPSARGFSRGASPILDRVSSLFGR